MPKLGFNKQYLFYLASDFNKNNTARFSLSSSIFTLYKYIGIVYRSTSILRVYSIFYAKDSMY